MRKLKFPLVIWLSYIGVLFASLLFATIFSYISYNTGTYIAEIHFTGIYKEIYETTKVITIIPTDQFLPITTVLILVGLLLIIISSVAIGPIFPSEKLGIKKEILITTISRFVHVTGSLIGIVGLMFFVCYAVQNGLLVYYHFGVGFIFTSIILVLSLLIGIFTIFFVEDKSKEIT